MPSPRLRRAAATRERTFMCRPRPFRGTSMCAIELPFDPREAFGRVRVPVRVTLRGHSYRSTICAMGGCWWVPLRTSNREAAGLRPSQRVRVTLALDDKPRTIKPPHDLAEAMREAGLNAAWKTLSFTRQREHAETIAAAKKPETRARRVERCLAELRTRQAR